MLAMGALVTSKADSTSAMRHRMCQADRAMRKDRRSCRIKGIIEGRKHERKTQVVQAWLLHTGERGQWTKELVDALHALESRNLEVISARNLQKRSTLVEIHRANQVRWAKKRFMDERRRQSSLLDVGMNMEACTEGFSEENMERTEWMMRKSDEAC